jgi:hypothetical protein
MFSSSICIAARRPVRGGYMNSTVKIAMMLYGMILLACIGLLVFASFADPAVQDKLFPIAEKSFLTVLGACIGALSSLVPSSKQ